MTHRIRNISWKSATMALAITGSVVLATSSVSAQAAVYMDEDLVQCLNTCSAKTRTMQCVSFNDFETCLDTVPECAKISLTSKDALDKFCRACGTGPRHCGGGSATGGTARTSDRTPTPHTTDAIAEPPEDRSDEALCKKKGGVYYRDEVDDPDVEGEVKRVEHCITLRDVVDRVIVLERKMRKMSANTAQLTDEDLAELRRLRAMKLPNNLMARLEALEDALEVLCPPIEKDSDGKDATLAMRCAHLLGRIADVEATAKDAKEDAARANKRLDDIHVPDATPAKAPDVVTRPESRYPNLRVAVGFMAHAMRNPATSELLLGPLVDVNWIPKITEDLRLDLMVGLGVSANDIQGANRPFMYGGVGLAGFPWHGDFLLEGLALAEHWYGTDEVALVNFYGIGGGVTWMPGASKKTRAALVPALGLRIVAGSTRAEDPADGSIQSHFDANGNLFLGLAF